MTERDMLVKKLATYDFAIVEINLYLDTHPWDTNAVRMLNEYQAKSDKIRKEYEASFGPVCKECSMERNAWVKSPWPWEGDDQ